MAEQARVSVAMCTYNGEQYIAEQLASIESQTMLPTEVVICDDGSSDSTMAIIESCAQASSINFRVIRNKSNLGVVGNFSHCLSLCQGDYIAMCDQDDVWEPQHIESSMQALLAEEGKFGKEAPLLVYSDVGLIDGRGKGIGNTFFCVSRFKPASFPEYRIFAVQNIAPGCSMVLNSELARQACPISDRAVMHDWWLLLYASIAGSVVFKENITVKYRLHSGNLMGVQDDMVSVFAKFLVPFRSLIKVKRNYQNSIAQFLDVERTLNANGHILPNTLRQYREMVSSPGIARLCPLFRGVVSRQRFLGDLSYFMGALLNLYMKIDK